MRLKRLVARGFKSFADRTEFEFDHRLTGIIGPNGCGKSNVVDAIKWVLGDQRAKSLRGTEMTDVIFKGAEGREAMGMAEVTITFEDPRGQVDGRTEVDISRRLTLDKESSYLLNGQEVRLKDVRDVLLDTGLGTGGYSVMEQGRIDAVLSANPEARRAIFEEAAGIARFKLQKKEALRKLERTDQNLARITDLLEERGRRIRSLRIQAGKARRFHELQAALRDLRAALAVLDGGQLRAQLLDEQQKRGELEAGLAAIEAGRDESQAQVRGGDEAIARCAQVLDGVRDELQRCQAELTTHRERGAAQGTRARELHAEAAAGRARGQALVDQRGERALVLATAQDGLVQKETELVQLHKQLAEQRQAVAASLQALRALQQQREQVRTSLLESLHQRTRARNQAADQEARRAAAGVRQVRLDERLQALAAEAAALQAQRQVADVDAAGIATRERILQERQQRALEDLAAADASAAELAGQEAALRNELSQVEGRRSALVAMEAHLEGLDEAPRHVLQQRPAGLRGRLLDLLEIDLAHSAALEAALGQNVQALVVERREHAAAIVAELHERQVGRVLLLVEEEFGELPAVACSLPLPPSAQWLFDLIRPTGAAAAGGALLAWLLRGVVLVETLEAADPRRTDLCFVTAAGSLLCGPRVEGGAAAAGHAGLVVRRSQIVELGSAAAQVQARLAALLTGKDQAVTRADRLKAEVRQLGEALQEQRRQGQAVEAQLARFAARAGDVQRETSELQLETVELASADCRALAVLGRALFDQHLLQRREQQGQAAESSLSEQIAAAQLQQEALVRAEQDLRLLQAQAGEAREGLLRTIAMHEQALRELEQALDESSDRVQQHLEQAARAAAEAERLQQLAAAVEEHNAGLQARREQQEAALAAAQQDRDRHRLALDECEQHRRSRSDALAQLRLQMADTEHRFARLEERLRDEAGVELRRLLGEVHGVGLTAGPFDGPPAPFGAVEELQGPPLPPAMVAAHYELVRLWLDPAFQPAEARKEVQLLQSQKERLGAVNLDALTELDDEEGQFTTLEQEVKDLKEARRSLLETLRKLEDESRTLFEQTFAEARKNFQEIFRKLFQGGKADMFLSNTEDLLEAGIEIVAQPPGKQLQSINLLSGGERSLTAVAILFALFKVRPSPFCILDEVDAALDETNVERFLRVLRDFTHGTQFCIVTHHKRTMADCQVLYGITMQRRGVSSRIAVALHEVDGFHETAVVGAAANNGGADPAAKPRIAGEEKLGFD